ncbi:MAG: cbb3-type cytochrome c oxidase N-terminal domain-containing protein [Verrucomicrobiota bacterium]
MSEEPKRGQFAQEKGPIILREHEFDGIQQFDQKLPNWWLCIFYGTIAIFVGYWFVYYGTPLIKSPQQTVTEQIRAAQAAQLVELNTAASDLNDSKLVHELATHPLYVAAGQAIFMKNCIPCHGVDLSATQDAGKGKRILLPGLPLNDHLWKFTKQPMGLFNLINKGSPPESTGNNGARMEAWGQKLSPVEIAQVLSYVISKVPEDFKDIPVSETP